MSLFDLTDLTLVSHDAGGAQILSSWACECSTKSSSVVDGPARAIFREILPKTHFISLEDSLKKTSTFITGTSWQSDLEKIAIKKAKSAGIYSISILDHWVTYKERFCIDSTYCFPDELWVVDKYALKLAQLSFNDIPITLIDNSYFKRIDKEINTSCFSSNVTSKNVTSALYICESTDDYSLLISSTKSAFGYSQQESYEYFLKNILEIYPSLKRLVIRPHPSQSPLSIEWMLNYNVDFTLSVSSEFPLIDQILCSDLVIGMESMALVVALRCKKKVLSVMPPSSGPLTLPFEEIDELRQLI